MPKERALQIVYKLLDGIAWRDCATPAELATLSALDVADLATAFQH